MRESERLHRNLATPTKRRLNDNSRGPAVAGFEMAYCLFTA
jgi:hypothetical protein